MWELDCEEGWVPKNWCVWTVVLEKTLESSLNCKEIQPVHSKGNHSWVFIGMNDAKAETPVLWSPRVKSWLIGNIFDAGREWGQEEKGTTEDEMAGWHHRLDGGYSEWTPGVGDGQGGLVCCNSWDHKESDMTEQLNWFSNYWTVTTKKEPVMRNHKNNWLWKYAPISTHLYFNIECYHFWKQPICPVFPEGKYPRNTTDDLYCHL